MRLNGETVYVDGAAVDNVLVHVGEFERGHYEQKDERYPMGVNADYTLYFPMDYLEDLTKRTITVRGHDCKVLGHPDHERPKQVFGRWLGKWDMTVKVQKTLSSFDDDIVVFLTTVTRDVMGERTVETREIYNGKGQARKQIEDEGGNSIGTTETETWYFVVPLVEELKTAQTQEITIQYNNKTFNVHSILDIDYENKQASIRAVWNG